MPPLYPHYPPLLIGLSQLLFPIVALLGVSGVVVGILNTYDEFSVPALTPVAWNLVIIAGLVFGVPHVHGADHKLYVYASSILAGTIVQVLRQIAFSLVPASLVTAVLAEPMIRLIYQRGAFTPDQTGAVAACLAALSLGLTFNGTMLMLNRSFFSLQENWIPTAVALGNLFLNAVLDVAFSPFGTWGIPLATSLVNIAGTGALLVFLRRRLGRIEFGTVTDSFVRVFV